MDEFLTSILGGAPSPPVSEALEQPESYKVIPLAGDASTRKYYRIVLGANTYVLMQWEPFHSEDYPFLSVQKHFLRAGVAVPEVVAVDEARGLVLLEDLGDLTLERKFWESYRAENSLVFYQRAMDQLLLMHFKATSIEGPCTAFQIRFDTQKLLWEMNYGFENLFVRLLNASIEEKQKIEVNQIFVDICTQLDAEPKYLVHRDYHSRNLMIKHDQMRVIDFQDARLGPVQYDLVSLIKDSYVQIDESMANRLLTYYLEKANQDYGFKAELDHFQHIYEIQSIQRCFKACGSFSSFFNQRQDRRYLKYIGPTLRRVLKSLTRFPQYLAFSDLIIDSGALEKQYEVL